MGVPDWPTQQNERSNGGTTGCPTDPITSVSGGGSPCEEDQRIVEGGSTEILYDNSSNKKTEEGLVDLEDSQGIVDGNRILNGNLETKKQLNLVDSGGTVTPSSKNKGKQNGMEGEGNTKTTFDDNNLNGNNNQNGCEWWNV